jgi:adenosine deaminase
MLCTDRGRFDPEFHPRRFEIKDEIVKQFPEVLGILLNECCFMYGKNGVQYVEFSVSCKDLLNRSVFESIADESFRTGLFKGRKIKPVAQLQRTSSSQGNRSNDELEQPPSGSFDAALFDANESDEATASQYTSLTTDAESEATDVERESLNFKDEAVSARIQRTKSIGNMEWPSLSLPTMLGSSRMKPAWKVLVPCHEKPTDQMVCFLAAFPRTAKAVYFYEGCTERGKWGRDERNQNLCGGDHLYANAQLGRLAKGKSSIERFLGNEASLQLADYTDLSAICPVLQNLAAKLTEDHFLAQIYPGFFGKDSKCRQLRAMLESAARGDELSCRQRQAIVGLDWVGDELGHPFCAFSHKEVIDLVAEWKRHNPRFGLRIHAGEGPLRPSTIDPADSPIRLSFYLHMYIVVEGIKKVIEALQRLSSEPVNVRIGHGVAFLFGVNEAPDKMDPFMTYMKEFRSYLIQHHIVCELNPTSNHMLLTSSFHNNKSLVNKRTLSTFLRQGLPVCLGTDDDGIWPIPICRQHGYHRR